MEQFNQHSISPFKDLWKEEEKTIEEKQFFDPIYVFSLHGRLCSSLDLRLKGLAVLAS
jgi:hypothetical protein